MVTSNLTPSSFITSERYFLPSSAYNLSCPQNGDNSGFLTLTLFQYLLGELGLTKIEIKSAAEYHHKKLSLSQTARTGLLLKYLIECFIILI